VRPGLKLVGRRVGIRAEDAGSGTRLGRILFSFGNWIAVCADHSFVEAGCVRGCRVVTPGPRRLEVLSRAIFAVEWTRRERSKWTIRGLSGRRQPWLAAAALSCARFERPPCLDRYTPSESRRFTQVYGCFEIPRGVPKSATSRGMCVVINGVIPALQVASTSRDRAFAQFFEYRQTSRTIT
jgi:hypothetical protein